MAIARGNKTISASNVMDAVRELDLPASMRKELRVQLDAYRDLQKQHAAARASAAAQSRERAKAARAAASAAAEAELSAGNAQLNDAPALEDGDGDPESMDVDTSQDPEHTAEAALAQDTPNHAGAISTNP